MTKYVLTIDERQAQTLSVACELIARLGIGQLTEAFRALPQAKDIDWTDWHNDTRAIGLIMSKYMPNRVDGYQSNIGIHNADDESRIAWDLHQVIRHRLSWDAAIAKGHTDGERRNWDEMMGVHYDEPSHITAHPLATIKKEVTP